MDEAKLKTLIVEYLKGLMSGTPTAKYKEEFRTFAQNQEEANKAMEQYLKSPEGRMAAKDIIQTKQSDRFVKRNLPLFNTLVQGADIATSIAQIRQSNQALKGLKQPTLPVNPAIDPALNNEIYKAQLGSFDQSRAVGAAQQENRDQYQRDLGIAGQVSGGDSATYAAQANAAGLRRTRNGAQLPVIQDSIRAREQSRLDSLIGRKMDYNQNSFNNNLALGRVNLDQYNQNLNSASSLGQTGRTNLRNVFQTLPQNALSLVGRQMGNTDPYSDYEDQVTNSLANLHSMVGKFKGNPIQKPKPFSPYINY